MRYVGCLAMKQSLQEVRLCSLQDVIELFYRKKKILLRLCGVGALSAFFFLCLKEPAYLIEASFKEQAEVSGSDGRDLVKQLFSGSSPSSASQTQSLMMSRTVLRSVVEKLGLQAELRSGSLGMRGIRRVANIIRAERRRPLDCLELFRFRDVFYEGEKPLDLTFFFNDPTHFDLFEGEKKLASGTVGAPLSFTDGRLTLETVPKILKVHKKYIIRLRPWLEVVQLLRKKIRIVAQKFNPSLYDLTYLTQDREGGILLLNELMAQLQNYLRQDHHLFAEQQLSYLSRRQQELFSQFEEELKAQASYQSQRLADRGCLHLSQELQVFLTSHLQMREKLLALDFEMRQIEEGRILQERSPLSERLKPMYAELSEWEKQKDLLEVSLASSPFLQDPDAAGRHLEQLREEKKKAKERLEQLQGKIFDADSLAMGWAKNIQRADAQDSLAHWIKILSAREKIAEERLFCKSAPPSEFEGIDWEASRALYKDSLRRLDESKVQLHAVEQALQQVQLEDAELGCLASSLKDPASQQLIASADAIYRQLKEDKYCSVKETSRWKEDLALQRRLFKEHLEQMAEVEKIHAAVLHEKLEMLQQIGLDCLHRHISLLQEAIQEEIAKRRLELSEEKQLLEQQMADLRSQLASLPEKWYGEQLFELKSKSHQMIMEAVVQLVETKTISHHLHQIGSKPVDAALSSFLPIFPYASLTLCLGSLLFSGCYFFSSLLKEAARGFSMNGEKLRQLGLPFSGFLSSSSDGSCLEHLFGTDIETLRSVCLFADGLPQARVIGLLGGSGPDFSFPLAELMSRLGKKVCLVRADFSKTFREKDLPGLLQILEGQVFQIPLRSAKGFDYLPSGGYSPFGTELLQSASFFSLLDQLKADYDLIFLYLCSPLEFSESKAALKVCDKAVIFLQGEPIDLLTPFISWAYDEEHSRLTFIASRRP